MLDGALEDSDDVSTAYGGARVLKVNRTAEGYGVNARAVNPTAPGWLPGAGESERRVVNGNGRKESEKVKVRVMIN